MKKQFQMCKIHKKGIILICKHPECNYELLCQKCISSNTHKDHDFGDIEDIMRDEISKSKEVLGKVANTCKTYKNSKNNERIYIYIRELERKKREQELKYENLIIQITKLITKKKNQHLGEFQYYLSLLQINVPSPQLLNMSLELGKQSKIMIKHFGIHNFQEIMLAAQNISLIRGKLEHKINSLLENNGSKFIAEIETKIDLKDKEFEDFCVQFPDLKEITEPIKEDEWICEECTYINTLPDFLCKSIYIYIYIY